MRRVTLIPVPWCLCVSQFVLDGTARMRERPIADLVDGLKQLGVQVTCSDTGCPPVRTTSALVSVLEIHIV